MKRTILLASAALMSLGLATAVAPHAGSAEAATTAAATMAAPSAQDFVTMAASSNMFEIESSKAALQKAKSAEVKHFAQKMIEDHTKAAKQMMATVQKSGGKLAMPMKMDPKHAGMMSTLDAGAAASFEKQYVMAQVQAHDEAVMLFSAYATGGDDPALKAFAAKTLPVLQQHQRMIHSISQKMS